MTQLAAQAAGAHTFNEAALRQTLGAIAQRSRATPGRPSTAPSRRASGRASPRR